MEASMARTACGGHVASFLLGAVAGAAAALLLAPRSGREAREYIADRGNEVGENMARRAQDLAVDVQGRAGTWLDRGRDALETEVRRVRDAFDSGREAMRDEIRRTGGAASS
jgi:gas vesicle protein